MCQKVKVYPLILHAAPKKVVKVNTLVSSTYSSVAKVLDPTLQDDAPAQGGVDQRPAGVDEVGRRLCVDQLVG